MSWPSSNKEAAKVQLIKGSSTGLPATIELLNTFTQPLSHFLIINSKKSSITALA